MIKTMNMTISDGQHEFELVDSVPLGYVIWNIGKNMIDGYLPLCRLSAYQGFVGGRSIETDTLKAIKTDGAQTILSAIGFGGDTVTEIQKYIAKHSGQKNNEWIIERMEKALPFMRGIKGL